MLCESYQKPISKVVAGTSITPYRKVQQRGYKFKEGWRKNIPIHNYNNNSLDELSFRSYVAESVSGDKVVSV